MNTVTPQVEAAVHATLTTPSEDIEHLDAVKDLAEIDLAYVGGGTAVIVFY